MDEKKRNGSASTRFLLHILEGTLIGLGAVLPGISGGVLCVVFGVYRQMMELLAAPFKSIKKHYKTLVPLAIGMGAGFLGVARILGLLLNKYPSQSVCLFAGLIGGMLPSLFRQAGEQGRTRGSFISMCTAFAVIFSVLTGLRLVSVEITPSFCSYIFCGVCLALSVIVPGMSFSTLLMPLELYTPFVEGLGSFDFSVMIPAGIGALATLMLLAKAINRLFEVHYDPAFHAIIGIVIAATVVIIPFSSFAESVVVCITNLVCLAVGVACALLLDRFNSKINRRMAE